MIPKEFPSYFWSRFSFFFDFTTNRARNEKFFDIFSGFTWESRRWRLGVLFTWNAHTIYQKTWLFFFFTLFSQWALKQHWTRPVFKLLCQLFLFLCLITKLFYFFLVSFSGITKTHSRYNYVVYFVFPIFIISFLFLLLSCFFTEIHLRKTFSLWNTFVHW